MLDILQHNLYRSRPGNVSLQIWSLPYPNQTHKTYLNKTRQEMPSKVHLRMWAVLVCEFGLFNQIQRCKKLLYTLDHLILSKIKINITWFTPNPCSILDNDYQAPIRIVQNNVFRNLMIICLRVVFFDPG